PNASGPRYGQVRSQPLPPMQTASAPLPSPSYPVQQSTQPAHPAHAVPRIAAASTPVQNSRRVGTHVVSPGETMFGIARKYHVSRTEIARANGLSPSASLRIGQRLTIPGAGLARQPHTRTASLTPTAPAAPASPPPAKPTVATRPAPVPAPARALAPKNPAPTVVASRTPAAAPAPEPVETARLATPAKEAAAEERASQPSATGAVPSFRWPVRG